MPSTFFCLNRHEGITISMNYLLSTGKGRIQISNHSIIPKVSMLSNVHLPISRAICSLLWEAGVVKSGASSKVQTEPWVVLGAPEPRSCTSGLCLNHSQASWVLAGSNRPAHYLLHGQSPSAQEQLLWKCSWATHPQILMASRTCDPSTRGDPGSPLAPPGPSVCLFSPLGLLGAAISQTSCHMFTENCTENSKSFYFW